MINRGLVETPTEELLLQMGSPHISTRDSSSEKTSDISAEPIAHCTERQRERVASHRDIQRTLKHGFYGADPRGNSLRKKSEFEGIVVIVEG
jgi:hypothetical protein